MYVKRLFLKHFPALSLLETFSNLNTLIMFTQSTMLNYPYLVRDCPCHRVYVRVWCMCVSACISLRVCVFVDTSFFLSLYTSSLFHFFLLSHPLLHSNFGNIYINIWERKQAVWTLIGNRKFWRENFLICFNILVSKNK